MNKRPLTPGYIFFYIMFLPDFWQILIGLLAAFFLTPLIDLSNKGEIARAMLYIMIATIGYTAAGLPAKWITQILKKLILGRRQIVK